MTPAAPVGGGRTILVDAAGGRLAAELGDLQSFDLADALAVMKGLGSTPGDSLAIQTVQLLASLMQAGVVAEASPRCEKQKPASPSL